MRGFAWLPLALLAVRTAAAAPAVAPLNASPSSILAGASTSVTVTAAISGGTPLTGGVNLVQEDASGNALSTLGVMHDDGLNGDAVANDGTYTLVVPLSPDTQTAEIYLQASAAFKGGLQRVKSSILTVPVINRITTVSIDPITLTFPAQNVGSASSAQIFSITNTGNQPVTISSVVASGDFAVAANNCPASLAVSTSCNVSVTFTPTAQGVRQSSVVITDSAGDSPQSVAVSGTGQAISIPTITINPTALTFPAQALNSSSVAQSFTITNSGVQAVAISSITTSGDFAITANACSASLAVAATCAVNVTFTPTATGPRSSSVVITDNASGSPQSVALSGTGQSIATPTVSIGPSLLTFPTQALNSTSAAQSFTITNSGAQAVTISSVATSGDFAIAANTCPASLAVAANCTVNVTFTPTASGARQSSVVIVDSASGSPQSVGLSGTGQVTGTPTITINPTALTFTAQAVNSTSAAQSFTITNSGSQAVTISSITTSGDFAITNNGCPASLALSTNCTVSIAFTPTMAGARSSSVVITDGATGSPQSVSLSGTGQPVTGPFTITSFGPASGSIGTVVKVVLNSFTPGQGTAPTVTMAGLSGGSISAPVSSFSQNALSFTIPPGAGTGPFSITLSGYSATSASPFTVSTSSNFTLNVGPGTANLIQGQSATFAVTVNSANGFDGLATLSLNGVPSGVQASFKPQAVTAGQTAVLTLTAPASQSKGTAALSFAASATIEGQSVSQTATASLNITGVTTTFLGRTVVDDAQETPVGGVTVKFLGKDSQGNTTGCSGQTTSDAGGNFALTNLASSCVGPQLISYDGTTATSPAGKYAGVNLSYTLVSGQVTASPVFVHLPRIDNAETVQVQQNLSTNQVFTFSSIPGLQVTVYAGTTFALDDGSQPNPFPLAAMDIPLDRLPEQTPTNGMLMNFVVAFQPANATASQPVAVVFPNPLNLTPLSTASLTTLDPTRGYMVPYGTTTVASDGQTFIPDMDPAHPGHRYGLVHFDWHTPLATLIHKFLVGVEHCFTCNPVDLSTGVETYTTTDLQVRGGRGSMAIQRTYRTLSTNTGPFGISTGFNYSMALNLTGSSAAQGAMLLVTPNGNEYTLSAAPDGTFLNKTIPSLRGVVITPDQTNGVYTLRQSDGTVYRFQVFPSQGIFGAYLTSITDLNGNTTTLTLNPAQPLQVLNVTDPVGRSMNLTYDNSNRITKITDPIGRSVKYTYNGQGTLASFTDASGGVTRYTYDSDNNVLTITDPRGIVVETNTYNESGDERIVQQVDAAGGVTKFSYTLLNPAAALLNITTNGYSPVLQTVLTDPLGHQTLYRFNTAGLLQSATDPSGQTTTLTHDTLHNNLITGFKGAGVCVICGDRANGDTSYTYDQFGNELTQTDALGGTTTFTYDSRFNKVNSITDSLGDVTRLTYDGNANLLLITDANGHQTQMAYDAFGEVTQITNAVGAVTSIGYDSFGNIISVTDALGQATTISYDAVSRLTQIVDSLGRRSTASYDSLNRLTSGTDPNGNTTGFSYDQIGDLLSLVDPRNNVVRFGYDSLGRLQKRTSQLGKVESVQYDSNSNPVQYTDRRGQVSSLQYDVNDRLVQVTYADSVVTGRYDANGRLLGVTDSQAGDFEFRYDAAGRLLTQTEPTGSVQYGRDALGRVTSRQVAGQNLVTYRYDSVGAMLSAATLGAGVTYQYDARNLPTSLTRTNGVVTSYSYDQLGQVLSIFHAKGPLALNTQRYTYDVVGNRSAINNDVSQPLITASTTSTVDTANELTTSGTISYTYDANGNRLTETGANSSLTYAWDSRNRLSLITDASGNSTAMTYDFGRNLLGLTYSTSSSSSQQRFVVDDIPNVVAVTGTTGYAASILTGPATDSHYMSMDSMGSVLFGITDAVGSIVGTTDATGRLASKLDYEPYGQLTGTVQSSYPFAFTGRIPVFGNVNYYRDRYYNALDGRFLSEDPAGSSGGINLYSYGLNNPVSNNDPTGDDPGQDAAIGGFSTVFDCNNSVKNIVKNVIVGAIGSKLGDFAGDRVGQFAGSAAGSAAVGVVGFLAPEEAVGAAGAATFFVVAIPAKNFAKAVVGGVVGAGGDVINQIGNEHYDYKATIAAFGSGFASSYAKSFKLKTAIGLVYNGIKRVVCGCPSNISDFGDPSLPFSKGPA